MITLHTASRSHAPAARNPPSDPEPDAAQVRAASCSVSTHTSASCFCYSPAMHRLWHVHAHAAHQTACQAAAATGTHRTSTSQLWDCARYQAYDGMRLLSCSRIQMG